MKPLETSPSDRATLLITAGSASVAFTVGFNLGAFGVVFFDQLLVVWVVATIVFVGSLVSSLPPTTWPRRLVLLVPTLWLIAAWVDNAYAFDRAERIAFALTVMVTMFVLPAVAWILITVINTDFAELPGRKKGIVIAAVALAMIMGFGFGTGNDLFLDCQDFKVSGSDLPENCLNTDSATP